MKKQLLLLLIAGMLACEKDSAIEPFVRTEDIIYLSGEQLILTGRLLSTEDVQASDHGFQIDKSEGFNAPQVISLGEKVVPGRFVGETDQLEAGAQYFCRAFAEIAGELFVGNTISVNTLTLSLQDFEPKIAREGEILTIRGSNLAKDTKVFFGEEEAEVISIDLESLVRVRIPAIQDQYIIDVGVESQGVREIFTAKFEYVIGEWELAGEFPESDNSRGETVSMENQHQVLFGTGLAPGAIPPVSQFWVLDKAMDTWTEVPFTGSPVASGFGAWPYFGTGALVRVGPMREDNLTLSHEFWKYEDGQFKSRGKLPFALYKSIGFVINDQLYVFGGLEVDRENRRQIFNYDPATGEWKSLPRAPILLTSDLPHFQYENKAYFITSDRNVHTFDPATSKWETVSQFPGSVDTKGIAQVVGDKVYIGLFENRQFLWEFNLSTYTWKIKISFPGQVRGSGNAISWEEDGVLYVMRNTLFNSRGPMQIWKFYPNNY